MIIVIARQGYTNLRSFKAEPAPPLGRQVQERLQIVRGWARGAGGQQEFAAGTGPPGIDGGHQPSSVSARAAAENMDHFRNPAPRTRLAQCPWKPCGSVVSEDRIQRLTPEALSIFRVNAASDRGRLRPRASCKGNDR